MLVLIRYAILLSLGLVLEVSAYPKPGNVHRFKDFSDVRFEDFIIAGVSAVHHLHRGIIRGVKLSRNFQLRTVRNVVGDIIYGIVRDSMDLSGGGNTSLGTALLLAPLSLSIGFLKGSGKFVEQDVRMIAESARALVERFTTPYDSIMMYRAVRRASPSYIRKYKPIDTSYPDVWSSSYKREIIRGNYRLWDILVYSSRYDVVAREIVEGYKRSIELVKYIGDRVSNHNEWNRVIVETYLYLLSRELDTLIVRKNGIEAARYVTDRAGKLHKLCVESWNLCQENLRKFDDELHRIGVNPGSTADIVASAISLYSVSKGRKIIRA
ncbi:MAG: triphosphoribosyl-dephospho-CoA synthase [Ignisphaera sp.]|nr:triphosphoribosyl-dephospho-CoA synthase [Ignisphaera sp.]MCX8167742.1 triphosphoribosyl-dephospho-CoA synthase [Ignisphaera sp.]MDW8085305.1 triphosphoribosyl-dephospho-CoA synthase [Ignisphaera sp.]